MSEASSRGRSSVRGRGGRGGFARGPRKPVNGEATAMEESLEDQGELGEMKKKFASELSMLKDMFPDWTDTDLVFALQESDGDMPNTVEKITQGNVSQFAEVKKPKDRARSKAKEEPATAGAIDKTAMRGGRGRGGFESARGGRGRGSDRGRGGFRGARGGHATTNGTQKDPAVTSTPTVESTAWDNTAATGAANGEVDHVAAETTNETTTDAFHSGWSNAVVPESNPTTAADATKSSLISEGGPKKSWASMFSQPKPAPAPPKQAVPTTQPPTIESVVAGEADAAPQAEAEVPKEFESAPQVPVTQESAAELTPEPAPVATPASATPGENLSITPSKDPLTEENVEHLPDESIPPATQTVASTAGSMDTRNLTPMPNQQAPIGSRPPMGGYAASAYRATGAPGRSASYQRRVQEQQEAVVLPGHNAVERAAVQFGSMGLNGEPGPDVDDDREEPETQQALQQSPPSQPRASLPPAPRQMQETAMPEGLPTPKQAPGLPPASQLNQQQMQDATVAPGLTQDQTQMKPTFDQYARYGQPGMQQDVGTHQQKPYDPFGHQAQQGHYDPYGSQQAQQQQQQSHAGGFGGLSSAPGDYSQYYTSSEQQRNAYNQGFYGGSGYGQDLRGQQQHGQHDTSGLGQQRSASGFGAGPNEAAYASQAQQQAQSRFAEAPGSGHNTPNPLGQQQQSAQSAQQQHSMHQQGPTHQQQSAGGYGGASAGYPYGHPYYQSPYQTAYANQFSNYGQQSGGYGGGYPQAKQGGMYGAPQGYGMGSHSSYEQHSSSPANAGPFAQNPAGSMRNVSGMSSGLGGGLDDYGRTSAQPASHQSSGFGGMNDPFARSASGFGGHAGYGQQQQSSAGPEDAALKPFDTANKSGPSPALGQPGRPGSAANSAAGSAHAGLPPPQQSQHSGFGGGYPGFPGQGSQYGLGGLGSHQQGGQQSGMGGQQGGYGQYGAGGFSQTYGGGGYGGSRGGWGSQYGAH